MASRKDIVSKIVPMKIANNIECTLDEWKRELAFEERRLYLYGTIYHLDSDNRVHYGDLESSTANSIVEKILAYNRQDIGLPVEERIPIMLYINSPGGSVTEGFSIISAIEASKTPVYTVNIGTWCSAAFLIGITGHYRLSLPNMMFLMHDGETWIYDSSSKAQDCMEFNKRFSQEVIKTHVLKYSKMDITEYDESSRKEVFMLPKDALEYGFIDKIITDIDDIL